MARLEKWRSSLAVSGLGRAMARASRRVGPWLMSATRGTGDADLIDDAERTASSMDVTNEEDCEHAWPGR
jgi:hypothetical protein